jgi:hypothetical protein
MPEVGGVALRVRDIALAAVAPLALGWACTACGRASGEAAVPPVAKSPVLNAPFAAGTTAANLQFGPDGCTTDACVHDKRVMVRWVARRTGTLKALYLEFKANVSQPVTCVSEPNGYGGGTSGTAVVATYGVRQPGIPDLSRKLSDTTLTPCKVGSSGSVSIPLDIETKRGEEFATVVRNVDPDPLQNYFSLNFLYDDAVLAGANGRNTRSPDARDVYYGLDPRELVSVSGDGGRSWRLRNLHYLPTYIQRYADGVRDGQPFVYATCPCPGAIRGKATMVFPRVPRWWTIRQLGAYTVGPGEARVELLVDNHVVRSAMLGGTGMLRARITPITVPPGSTVKVRTRAGSGGLAIQRIDADTPWKHGPVLRLGRRYRFYYLEAQGGGAAEQAAVTVYPLPMYPVGAD